MEFSEGIYHGFIVKGELLQAIQYVKQFPEKTALYDRFMEVYEREHYLAYEVEAGLNEILERYQRYYRDVFYLRIGRAEAADKLRAGLAELLGVREKDISLSDMEQKQITEAFAGHGFFFLGGRTSGYYGPYVWKTTETKTYTVELPDGTQTYTVKLLDGFIANSWLDYLSFGEIGTGGWTDGNGIINCIKSSYDLDSENFKVSLLKHEAQHAWDLANAKNMSSEDLEYRAKLVELIYSTERKLLTRFAQEADSADKNNGHALASSRIRKGFAQKLGMNHAELEGLSNRQVQAVARELFEESTKGLYGSALSNG